MSKGNKSKEAGKGSAPRKVDASKWDAGWEHMKKYRRTHNDTTPHRPTDRGHA